MSGIINIFEVDCDDVLCPDGTLGALSTQTENCNDVNLSEVNSIILKHPTLGDNITNWGPALAAGDFNIDNADATDVAQKQIFVTGGVAEPEETEVTLNGFQTVTLNKTFTLSAEFYSDGSQLTYDYLRKLECNKVKPDFWFTTMGGKIFGKDGGITPSKFSLSKVLEQGEESVEKWVMNIQWKALTSPDRYDNPL